MLTIICHSADTLHLVDYPGLNFPEECKVERVYVYSIFSSWVTAAH